MIDKVTAFVAKNTVAVVAGVLGVAGALIVYGLTRNEKEPPKPEKKPDVPRLKRERPHATSVNVFLGSQENPKARVASKQIVLPEVDNDESGDDSPDSGSGDGAPDTDDKASGSGEQVKH